MAQRRRSLGKSICRVFSHPMLLLNPFQSLSAEAVDFVSLLTLKISLGMGWTTSWDAQRCTRGTNKCSGMSSLHTLPTTGLTSCIPSAPGFVSLLVERLSSWVVPVSCWTNVKFVNFTNLPQSKIFCQIILFPPFQGRQRLFATKMRCWTVCTCVLNRAADCVEKVKLSFPFWDRWITNKAKDLWPTLLW